MRKTPSEADKVVVWIQITKDFPSQSFYKSEKLKQRRIHINTKTCSIWLSRKSRTPKDSNSKYQIKIPGY